MQEGDFSKSFYITVSILSIILVIIVFSFMPDSTKIEFVGEGASMEPTLQDGDEIVVNSKRKPQAGDIIVFKCHSKCREFPGGTMTKRLHEIDGDGCYWVLGDNQEVSYDSRAFGKLCPQDLELYGVVTDVLKNN